MKDVFAEDKPQINQSWIFKERLDKLLAVRILLFTLLSAIWWFEIYEGHELQFLNLLSNFKYLTYVGLTLAVSFEFLAVLHMLFSRFKQNIFDVSCLWKLEHFLFQAAFASSITIILLFWIGDYPNLTQEQKDDTWTMFNNVLQHGCVFLLIYIEFFINNIDFKYIHLYPITVFFIFYLIGNLIVTFTYQPVYDIMDWVSVISYVFTVGGAALAFFHFYFAKYIYHRFKINRIIDLQPFEQPLENKILNRQIINNDTFIQPEKIMY